MYKTVELKYNLHSLVYEVNIFLPAQQRNAGVDRFISEASRSHTVTHQSVGLLQARDRSHRRDIYLTTNKIQNRQTSMPPERFETEIPACDRP